MMIWRWQTYGAQKRAIAWVTVLSVAAAVQLNLAKAQEINFPLRFFALGDWGYATKETKADPSAQRGVAEVMLTLGQEQGPAAVITHGDMFYWGGVANPGSKVFADVFEDVYPNTGAMQNVPFVITLGNHDVGGDDFLCGNDPGNNHDRWHTPCSSTEETKKGVMQYYEASAQYTRERRGTGRYDFGGSYFKRSYEIGGVKAEIYTTDLNFVDAGSICCQRSAYGRCLSQINPSLFKACLETLHELFEASLASLQKDLEASTADWRIVNSHYCPFRHAADDSSNRIMSIIGGKVHVWLCGHTHATTHDYHSGGKVHFIMNGAGGGIILDGAGSLSPDKAAKTVWSPPSTQFYAVTDIQLSKRWMKLRFMKWAGTNQGVEQYCTGIPNKPGSAVACNSMGTGLEKTEEESLQIIAQNISSNGGNPESGLTSSGSGPLLQESGLQEGNSNSTSTNGNNLGAGRQAASASASTIIGGVLGAFAFVGVVALIAVHFRKRQRHSVTAPFPFISIQTPRSKRPEDEASGSESPGKRRRSVHSRSSSSNVDVLDDHALL